jgi:hypothetical protein
VTGVQTCALPISLKLKVGVTMVDASLVETMLIRDDLPELEKKKYKMSLRFTKQSIINLTISSFVNAFTSFIFA